MGTGWTNYTVANFLQCMCAKNYENCLAVDKAMAKNSRLTFLGPPCGVFRVCTVMSVSADGLGMSRGFTMFPKRRGAT